MRVSRGVRRDFVAAGIFFALFALWSWLVCTVDVRAVGPCGSEVGLATLNLAFHQATGVHLPLYEATDWLSLVPLGIVLGFGVQGLSQLVKRRRLMRVDRSLLLLGCFYVVLLAVFLLFEALEVNYRPVLIEGALEASYPSSTTLLVMCVMPTALVQLELCLTKPRSPLPLHASTFPATPTAPLGLLFLRTGVLAFTAFMVAARLFSGVHWFSDVAGAALLSAGLVFAYRGLALRHAGAQRGTVRSTCCMREGRA